MQFHLQPTPRPVIYLINIDWFFRSHFVHLARRAAEDGRRVILICQTTPGGSIDVDGLEIIPLSSQRAGFRPRGLAHAADAVENCLKRYPDAIIHAFGTYGVVVATLATRRRPAHRLIFHITGRGYLAASKSFKAVFFRRLLRRFYRLADNKKAHWIAENSADLEFFGLRDPRRTVIVPGAGVDLQRFQSEPIAAGPTLRLGFVSRLIRSKGLDVAVAAVKAARARGHDVTLTIAGSPDPGNPGNYDEASLRQMSKVDGVEFLGHISEIEKFWKTHDASLLPSLGGEGVPKALLEACACGRPIITTKVPGCMEVARDTGGWTVRPNRIDLLTNAIIEASKEKLTGALAERGQRSAAFASSNYGESLVWQSVSAHYL